MLSKTQIFLGAACLLLKCLAVAQDIEQSNCQEASTCSSSCSAPDCACSLSEPDIPVQDRPQIIYLTFDGALTPNGETKLAELFDGQFLNPNRCPIRGTHYLAHYYTDYSIVNDYYNRGHEIASLGITQRSDPVYWAYLKESEWADEMGGMKQIISWFANIPAGDIQGMRAPYLNHGGDTMYSMMADEGFTYDHSQPSVKYGYLNLGEQGAWPYTLDYKSEMDCQITPCPKCKHDGLWAQPILDLEDSFWGATGDSSEGAPCDALESCVILGDYLPEDVFEMLHRNFERSYLGNTRAPINLYVSGKFFDQDWQFEGYKMFVDHVVHTYNDVWFVPVAAGIQYRKTPVTNDEVGDLDGFRCDNLPNRSCNKRTCQYTDVFNEDFEKEHLNMVICDDLYGCPPNYPWLGNPEGN